MGWINDKNLLNRKILIIIGSIFCAVSLYKLFINEQILYEYYLFVWISILYLGWTLFQIPYLSIGYDLEKNYFLRTKLSAMRELSILLGLFFSLGFPMFFNLNNIYLLKYIAAIAIFSGLIGVPLMLSKTPDNRILRRKIKLKDVFTNLKKTNS